MDEIAASSIPFPHRAGNLYKIQHLVFWGAAEAARDSEREAYVNYRDLDIGANNDNGTTTSYPQAKIWGSKYFKNNFDRLVRVKTVVDPGNFFKNEQSIPSLVIR
ncbi:cannabidiolic acid synthase-like [Henckelia pumila]|uniref:cannabidiolic acid synthase-like n=1 Tax=Henckelia pumila TaxID=405737 RepID=UPI003C6DF41C